MTAPSGLGQGLTTGLAHVARGGFTVLAVPSTRAVIDGVLSQSAAGGLVTDGYLAAVTNYSFLAHAVWTTEQAVSHLRGDA